MLKKNKADSNIIHFVSYADDTTNRKGEHM